MLLQKYYFKAALLTVFFIFSIKLVSLVVGVLGMKKEQLRKSCYNVIKDHLSSDFHSREGKENTHKLKLLVFSLNG